MSNFKKLVAARMAKTGESYSTAARHLRSQVETPLILTVATPDPVDTLIQKLRPVHVSSILIGTLPLSVAGANYEVLKRHLDERVRNHPQYFAETASFQTMLSESEYRGLLGRGATPRYETQKIRLMPGQGGSVPCAHCTGWILIPFGAYSGACDCGEKFEVSFDGDGQEKSDIPEDWLCMKCGEPFDQIVEGDARNPWHGLNDCQQVCNICFHIGHVGPWWMTRVRSGVPIVNRHR